MRPAGLPQIWYLASCIPGIWNLVTSWNLERAGWPLTFWYLDPGLASFLLARVWNLTIDCVVCGNWVGAWGKRFAKFRVAVKHGKSTPKTIREISRGGETQKIHSKNDLRNFARALEEGTVLCKHPRGSLDVEIAPLGARAKFRNSFLHWKSSIKVPKTEKSKMRNLLWKTPGRL